MTDELKLHRDQERAAKAEALLRNELLQEAFAILDTEYIKAWRLTDIRDTDARERLHQAVQIVAKIKDHLSIIVRNGTLARRQIDEIEAKRKRNKEVA